MKSLFKLLGAAFASFVAYVGYYVYRVNKDPKNMGTLSETMKADAEKVKEKLSSIKWEAMDDDE